MRKLTEKQRERFMSKVTIEENCWVWGGSKNSSGYGYFSVNNKTFSSHRVSYFTFRGEIGKGLYVCHMCDNPSCVRPSHLFIGTASANMRDMFNKGRCNRAGEKNTAAKLNNLQVSIIRFLLKESSMSQKRMGKLFGVGQTTISTIKTGQNWQSNGRMVAHEQEY